MPAPSFPSRPSAALELQVRTVGYSQPFQWLRRGGLDLWRCPGPGLLHGLLSSAFGLALLLWAHEHFWILAGAFSGFLIVAPILATGLYAVSQALELGERASMQEVLHLWRSRDPRLLQFGLLLGLAGSGWVLTSASMVTSFSDLPVQRPLDFLRHVVLQDRGWVFEAWLLLGGVLAAPVFASSVVALPLLMDRPVSVLSAVLTSWRAVQASPGPLALWAGLIMAITLLGMLCGMLGLVLTVPWLAHSSWHAYRNLVEPGRQARAEAPTLAGGP